MNVLGKWLLLGAILKALDNFGGNVLHYTMKSSIQNSAADKEPLANHLASPQV